MMRFVMDTVKGEFSFYVIGVNNDVYLKEINLKRTSCSMRFDFQGDSIELGFFMK